MKFIVFMVMMLSSVLFAKEIATVKLLKGDVKASLHSKSVALQVGSTLDEEMVVQSAANSSVTIVFNDNSVLVLGENSIVSLKKYLFKPKEELYDFEVFLETGSAVLSQERLANSPLRVFDLKRHRVQ